MEIRYENALSGMLEKVAFEAFASAPKWQIARWYGQTSFSLNVRRDLRERWKTLTRDELGWKDTPVLKIAEVGGSIILLNAGHFFPDQE